ncbi:MAG: cobalamin biosynthesis protein CbiB, partial [Betaproteobacteria bacterium]|nr:cobalamin biosynthesis protein CbiB [Betaproteobacteria bacterium]
MWLGWPAALVWSVAVLYATLGFRQFSSHFTQIREALANSDETLARDLLANWRQIDVRDLPRSEVLRSVMAHSVIAAHRHVFGVLAFFSLLAVFGLGPAGAVLYRASEFLARFWRDESQTRFQPVSQQTQDAAGLAWDLLDWVPARITA